MNHTQQYYFSVEKLRALIDYYSSEYRAPDNNTLKGFVFTPGFDANGFPRIFAFPLYSMGKKGGIDGDFLVQNTIREVGCPYPPKCRDKIIDDTCYDN